MELTETQRLIEEECDKIKTLLLQKNKAYGNSALEPLRIFSKSDSIEQINVRLDDKLSRLLRGSLENVENDIAMEDVESDIVGYIILKKVARILSESKSESKQEEFDFCKEGN